MFKERLKIFRGIVMWVEQESRCQTYTLRNKCCWGGAINGSYFFAMRVYLLLGKDHVVNL